MRPLSTTVDQKIERLASCAWGVVTRKELLALGVTANEIRSRVRRGWLLRVHAGVYRVGHRAPSVEASYTAAVKACGEGTLLSGQAAGYLFGLLKGIVPPPEVTSPRKYRLQGVRTHRGRLEGITVRGIPVTTVPQTLVDLAAVLELDALARACHEAGVRYRTTPRQVGAVLERYPNAPGAGKLRAVMGGDARVTLSKLERRFLQLLREHGLPLPVMNRPAGGRRVDCRWPEHRLTVELDSYGFHNTRRAWEQDRRREREAYARGDQFRRYTYGDVFERPARMLAELRGLLIP
jgi:hypothetical protein